MPIRSQILISNCSCLHGFSYPVRLIAKLNRITGAGNLNGTFWHAFFHDSVRRGIWGHSTLQDRTLCLHCIYCMQCNQSPCCPFGKSWPRLASQYTKFDSFLLTLCSWCNTFMPAVPKRAAAKSCLGAGKKSTRLRPLLLTLAFFFG